MNNENPTTEKSCIDCTEYLLCKNIKEGLCNNFVDNFSNTEDEEITEETTEDLQSNIQYCCNGVSKFGEKCLGCIHSRPHNPDEEHVYLKGFTDYILCTEEEGCEDVNEKVKCIPV